MNAATDTGAGDIRLPIEVTHGLSEDVMGPCGGARSPISDHCCFSPNTATVSRFSDVRQTSIGAQRNQLLVTVMTLSNDLMRRYCCCR